MLHKKESKLSLKMISRAAVKSSEKAANSACYVWQYQPKMPDKVKKLRKF